MKVLHHLMSSGHRHRCIAQSCNEIQLKCGAVGLNAQVMEYAGPTGAVKFIYGKQSVLDAFPEDYVAAQKELKQMVGVWDAVFEAAPAHILPGALLEIQERVIDIHQDGGYILFSEHYGRYRSVSGFQQERNLITLAQAAVHHADNGNRSLDAQFHIGLAVYVLLKNETGALAVQVEA